MFDIENAKDKVMMGIERKSMILTPYDKRIIAYHEAGHAIVAELTPGADPIHKVTIVPRGMALGVTQQLPIEDKYTHSRTYLNDTIKVLLGGRAAEEVMFGKISTGALSDLEKVTKQAYAMVSVYGLSDKLGNISYYDSSGQNEYSFNKPYSEKTAELIDEEVKKMIEESYQRTLGIIRENKDKLILLADKLLEKEVLFRDDLELIFGKSKFEDELKEEKKISKKKNISSKKDTEEKTEISKKDETSIEEKTESKTTTEDKK